MLPALPILYSVDINSPQAIQVLQQNVQGLYVYLQRLRESFTDSVSAAVLDAGAVYLGPMTTAERDALVLQAPALIYNSTLNKFQGYEAGAWVNLI